MQPSFSVEQLLESIVSMMLLYISARGKALFSVGCATIPIFPSGDNQFLHWSARNLKLFYNLSIIMTI